jgi:hypothetical protein
MNFNRRHFLGAVAVGSAGLVAPSAFASVRASAPPALLGRAKAALDAHGSSIIHRDVMGIVDFGVSSGQPRFHLIDIAGGRVAASYFVAHGRGSDPQNSGWLQRFSNQPGSNASSQGSYVIGQTYYGKHGRSRRIKGLDPENSQAASRAIVIHGASYVSPVGAQQHGRVGRSLGCFSVPTRDINEVLANLGEGRLLFAWK